MLIFRQLATLVLFAVVAVAQTSYSGTLENGSKVRLFVDGTWEYVERPAGQSNGAVVRVETAVPRYALSYDSTKWTPTENGGTRLMLQHSSGQAFAVLMGAPIPISVESLVELNFNQTRRIDPEADIISSELTSVSDTELMKVDVLATASSISFHYRSLYFGGENGNAVLSTFAIVEAFADVESDLDELLSGFEIDDVAKHAVVTSGARTIDLLGGATLTIDSTAWTLTSAQPSRRLFSSPDGSYHALLIEEPIQIPVDKLAEVALLNAGTSATAVEVVLDEDLTIGGMPARRLIFNADPMGAKFTYYGLYFSSSAGSFQLLGYTSPQLFDDKKAVFEAFHAGFAPPGESE